MWLLGRLAPDFKTIADFRKDNGAAFQVTCRAFVQFCRQAGLIGSMPRTLKTAHTVHSNPNAPKPSNVISRDMLMKRRLNVWKSECRPIQK
jgi:transposase